MARNIIAKQAEFVTSSKESKTFLQGVGIAFYADALS